MFLHRGNIGKRDSGRHAIKAGEANVTGGILDHVPVEIGQRAIRTDLRSGVFVSKEAHKAVIATRFLGQQIGPSAVCGRAECVCLRAVNANADKIGKSLTGIRFDLGGLRRIRAKYGGDVNGRILKNGVSRGNRAKIATGARK